MYKPGLLSIAPACGLDADGDPLCVDAHSHPIDARSGYARLVGGVYLPHSCDSWVIGGPSEIRALIEDLTIALDELEKPR